MLQELFYRFEQGRIRFDFALPNYECFPPRCPKLVLLPEVAFAIAQPLVCPELRVGLRQAGPNGTIMSMPETAINEYHFAAARENKIGLAGQLWIVQPVTVPHAVKQPT
jgi:hypothetical protein